MGAKQTIEKQPPDLSNGRVNAAAMNEALMIGSVRQHELTEAAVNLNAQLQLEIAARLKTSCELAEKARLLDLSNDAIIVRGFEGRITYWNHGAEELYGWTREEALGKVSHTLLKTEFPVSLEKMTEELYRNDRWIGELVHTRRDGQRITVLARKSLDRDRQGNSDAVLEIITDITERKKAEGEIRRLNSELEQRVAERTAELQAANEEMEAFSYSVAHDLRAPLRHVMAFVELLQKDAGPSLSEINCEHLATISRATKRMGNLIDDLLAFSRVGRAEMQKTECDLNQLVQETLRDFQADTKERKIVWEIHPLPSVRADYALLRMVLVNLISNAVKFTGNRTAAKIEIGCAPSEKGETVIFIRDNGAGFDPEYAEKLFGVFQRLHSRDEFEGTGIGLANVQRIIKRHGGRVWAEGVLNSGATFYFSIPKQNGDANGH
jgi:PAS domain S-box-containing protein